MAQVGLHNLLWLGLEKVVVDQELQVMHLIAGSTYGNSSVEEFTIPFGTATISSS